MSAFQRGNSTDPAAESSVLSVGIFEFPWEGMSRIRKGGACTTVNSHIPKLQVGDLVGFQVAALYPELDAILGRMGFIGCAGNMTWLTLTTGWLPASVNVAGMNVSWWSRGLKSIV